MNYQRKSRNQHSKRRIRESKEGIGIFFNLNLNSYALVKPSALRDINTLYIVGKPLCTSWEEEHRIKNINGYSLMLVCKGSLYQRI